MNREAVQAEVAKIQWFHDYEIVPGVWTHGVSSMKDRVDYFEIPSDLSDQRILDVGSADGYFTFLAEERGAEVVSIDSWPRRGYFLAHDLRESKAEFHQMSVYDITPEELGLFDIVFFFGVYYHLKHPVLALERIASVTKKYAIIESEVVPPTSRSFPTGIRGMLARLAGLKSGPSPDENIPYSRLYPHDELGGDPTNWWVPNATCLVETIRAAGFPRVESVARYGERRGIVHAHKGPRTAGRILTEDFLVAIDQPVSEVRGLNQINGWAVSQLDPRGGIDSLYVYLDSLDDPDAELGRANYPISRPDLAQPFPDQYAYSGFNFTWDTANVPAGPHTLYVMAVGERGWGYRARPIKII